MCPQDTESGSSSIPFSRGYPQQHRWLPEALASTLPPSEGSLQPRSLQGQAGPTSYPMEKFTTGWVPLNALEQEIEQEAPLAVFHGNLFNLSLTSLAKPLPNYIKRKLEKKSLHQQTDYCRS